MPVPMLYVPMLYAYAINYPTLPFHRFCFA